MLKGTSAVLSLDLLKHLLRDWTIQSLEGSC